jgi:hypothetical protein
MAIKLPNDIQRLLIQHKLVPENCSNVALVFPAAGIIALRYEVFATLEQLETLGGILTAFVEHEKSLK